MLDHIIIGTHKFARGRLRTQAQGGSYKVGANRTGMVVYFVEPNQAVRIEGADNVVATLQELELALDPDDDGWR